MYDELIEQLRSRASWLEFAIIKTPSKTDGNGDAILFRKAANAIEDLNRKEKFHAFLWNTIQPNEMEAYLAMYNAGNEKEKTEILLTAFIISPGHMGVNSRIVKIILRA